MGRCLARGIRGLVGYRISIVDFERQKGTILRYANIYFDDDIRHHDVQANASGHIRRWHQLTRKSVKAPANGDEILAPVVDDTFSIPKSVPASVHGIGTELNADEVKARVLLTFQQIPPVRGTLDQPTALPAIVNAGKELDTRETRP